MQPKSGRPEPTRVQLPLHASCDIVFEEMRVVCNAVYKASNAELEVWRQLLITEVAVIEAYMQW